MKTFKEFKNESIVNEGSVSFVDLLATDQKTIKAMELILKIKHSEISATSKIDGVSSGQRVPGSLVVHFHNRRVPHDMFAKLAKVKFDWFQVKGNDILIGF